MKLDYKYKLFRRFPPISLLAQSSWRMISSTTGWGLNLAAGAQLFLNSSNFFSISIFFSILVRVRVSVGVRDSSFIRYLA